MDYYMIFGMVAVCVIALVGFYITFVKYIKDKDEPTKELNINLTKLNANFEHMIELDEIRDRRITTHGKEIDELRNGVNDLDKRVTKNEVRVDNLEEKMKKGG